MFAKTNSVSPASSLARRGTIADVFPLVAAFVAISFAFGVLAREAGLPLWVAALLSATTYAGTAQVVALGLIAANQPVGVIILVVGLINARFLLLSSVMAPRVRHWPRLVRWMFALQLTDETFALMLPARTRPFPEPREAMALQWGAYIAWVLGTVLGFTLGGDSQMIHSLGLDFALVAMMLAVLVLQLADSKAVAVAAFAGGLALVFSVVGLSWISTLAAAVIAPLIGVWLEGRCKHPA